MSNYRGANAENYISMYNMIKKSNIDSSKDVVEFTDEDNVRIRLDLKKGVSYTCDNEYGQFKKRMTGEESRKRNGYVYTPLNLIIDTGDGDFDFYYKKAEPCTHAIIAMVKHMEEFESLYSEESMPVANHMNNCPFDNRAENLEWVTPALNSIHGKLVHALERAMQEGKIPEDVIKYRSNKNKNRTFTTLAEGISCRYIEEYIGQFIEEGMSYYKVFGAKSSKASIPVDEALKFWAWYQERKIETC